MPIFCLPFIAGLDAGVNPPGKAEQTSKNKKMATPAGLEPTHANITDFESVPLTARARCQRYPSSVNVSIYLCTYTQFHCYSSKRFASERKNARRTNNVVVRPRGVAELELRRSSEPLVFVPRPVSTQVRPPSSTAVDHA